MHICNLEGVHMRTVAVTINKGGVGKTTLTKSLATAATAAGLNVLILDMDTQENSASWGQRRNKQHEKPASPYALHDGTRSCRKNCNGPKKLVATWFSSTRRPDGTAKRPQPSNAPILF